MSTATEPIVTEPADEVPYPITSDIYLEMIERGLIPSRRRVYLWDGRLFEKMAKTVAHAAVHCALIAALSRRLARGLFLGVENPIRLDDRHTPLPDLVVLRGEPLDLQDLGRYPDQREIVLVAEVAVSSLLEDLGGRLSRYARTLPDACYVVADVRNRRLLLHRNPVTDDQGNAGYAQVESIGPGQEIRLNLAGVEIDPIPFEELMR